MKKIWHSILIMAILIFIGLEILIESKHILSSVLFSFQICVNNIFPSLFPFFVLSEILTNYGFVEFLGEICKPMMGYLFKTKGEAAFIFIMSMISGSPSNAKYTRELYLNNIITAKEASKILMFSHFSNPLFILGTISLVFLNNKEVGLLILIAHYATNVLIGILFRNYEATSEKKEKLNFKKAILSMHERRITNDKTFGAIVTTALQNSINTLLLILGVVTVANVLSTIIDQNINLNHYYQCLLNGVIEMTQGLKYVSLLNIPLKIKTVLSTMMISFGGISVHLQVISILSDTKIEYLPFLVARIFHAFFASLLVYLLFDTWMYLV